MLREEGSRACPPTAGSSPVPRSSLAFHRTSTIAFLEAGGYPDDLQTLMGWSSSQMLRHYTKARATERAVAAHKRLSPSDRLTLR